MENKLFDRISETFNPPLPEANTLEEYLDTIIPMIKAKGEDLREESFYTDKHWVEIQDNENFHQLVFHFFNAMLKPDPEEGKGDDEYIAREYLKTTDGEVTRGKWRYIGNKLFIGDKDYEHTKAYELAFMDDEFLILKLLADPKKFTTEKKSKYFVLAVETLARKLEWLDLVKHLFGKYHTSNMAFYIIAIFLAMVAIIMLSR